ncbi:hypothetical protein [Cellulomonas sp. SLBN-39]|uniref:DNA polymerase Y family protein n=1 Tax=Cellulomonas sp. SLBN-39 TaxID=2768446 RepID=UPI0011515115|nr:hypothetical protein [Cellulomonas sp. SLBN-39]TQL04458.1 impB/mucB/samB family protein [Cellulomonas sp. SLBN-39]
MTALVTRRAPSAAATTTPTATTRLASWSGGRSRGLGPRDENGCHVLHVRTVRVGDGSGADVADVVRRVLLDVTALVEPTGDGGAFLDVSGARHRLGRPTWIAGVVRERLRLRAGLTCGIGVAASKCVAELASVEAAPDGVVLVPRSAGADFLRPRLLADLPGVPARVLGPLAAAGYLTVGDVADAPLADLQRRLGAPGGRRLHDLALGRDPRPVRPASPPAPHGEPAGPDGGRDVARRSSTRSAAGREGRSTTTIPCADLS